LFSPLRQHPLDGQSRRTRNRSEATRRGARQKAGSVFFAKRKNSEPDAKASLLTPSALRGGWQWQRDEGHRLRPAARGFDRPPADRTKGNRKAPGLVRAQKKAALLEPPYLLIVVTVSARLSSCHRSDKPQSRKKVSLSRRAGRAATVRRATRPLSHEPLPKVRPNFLAPNPAPAIYRGARPVQSRFVCSTEKGVYAAFVRFAASPFRATPSRPAHSLLYE